MLLTVQLPCLMCAPYKKNCLVLQGSLQEQEDSESDSSLSQSPSVQDWLAQARTTRSQQHEDSLQRQRVHFNILYFFPCISPQSPLQQRLWPGLCCYVAFQELEEQLAEQKKLLQSVASRGEEILIQQASPSSVRYFTYC